MKFYNPLKVFALESSAKKFIQYQRCVFRHPVLQGCNDESSKKNIDVFFANENYFCQISY